MSNDTTGQAINIQAKSLLPGDDLALNGTYTGSAGEFSSGDNFVGMYPGDIVYGKFNKVALDEAQDDSENKAVKIILYRGL